MLTIDGSRMLTRGQAHDELARALELPAHYGRNLDALWDVLSEVRGEVVLVDSAAMLNALEAYGCKLMQTLFEAAVKNPCLVFRVE